MVVSMHRQLQLVFFSPFSLCPRQRRDYPMKIKLEVMLIVALVYLLSYQLLEQQQQQVR
jgi:hypothetical protein